MIYNIFSTLTQVLGRFFTDPDFSGSDPDFWPIRIRTQKKNLIRIRKTETLVLIIKNYLPDDLSRGLDDYGSTRYIILEFRHAYYTQQREQFV